MDFFISQAMAQSGESSGGGLLSLVPLVLIFVLFYFLLIRPQQKRTKNHKAMVDALEVGDEVVTNGGLLGTVTLVDPNFVRLEVTSGVEVYIQRMQVAALMPEDTIEDLNIKKQKKASKKNR